MTIQPQEFENYFDNIEILSPALTANPAPQFAGTLSTVELDINNLSQRWRDCPTIPASDNLTITAYTQAPTSLELKITYTDPTTNTQAETSIGERLDWIRNKRDLEQANFIELLHFQEELTEIKQIIVKTESIIPQTHKDDIARLHGQIFMELAITQRLLSNTVPDQSNKLREEYSHQSFRNFATAARVGLSLNDLDLLAMVSVHVSKADLAKHFYNAALEHSCAGYAIASTVNRKGDIDWFAKSLLQTMIAKYGYKTVWYFTKLYYNEAYFRGGINKVAKTEAGKLRRS